VPHDPPDPSASERLAAATRRLVDLVRRTQAHGADADEAVRALERAAQVLEPYAHPGPFHQRALAWDGTFTPVAAPTDFADFFPYSPIIGRRNPLAPPAVFEARDGRIHGHVTFDAAYTGPPKSVHGGVIAALFDELLGSANLVREVGGMTGTLRIVYRNPSPIGEELRVEGWVDRIEGRKVFACGTLHHGDLLLAEADGIFIQGSMQRFAEAEAAEDERQADPAS
jgi:acyl-coenzyme A thioesterase PaaI-like protein